MKIILEMLSYPFLVRALVVGVLVSLCASLLGVSLVLKRYSMMRMAADVHSGHFFSCMEENAVEHF